MESTCEHVRLWAFSDWERDNVRSTFRNLGTYKIFHSLDRPEKNLRSRTNELCHKHSLDKELLYFYKAIAFIQLVGVFPSLRGTSSWLSSSSGYLVIISSWGAEEWRMLRLETAWDHRSPLLITTSQTKLLCYSCAALWWARLFPSAFFCFWFPFTLFPSTFLCWILVMPETVLDVLYTFSAMFPCLFCP